ncbi:MAG: sodium:proton antiporter, partial [Zoogloea sp.]|nr:sodium:proton antiporter [Zoogloea sp.]
MDELLEIGVALGLAGLVGEVAARLLRLPRITGYALTGLALGPAGLRWLEAKDIDTL